MKKLYAWLVYRYAQLAQPGYHANAIVYLRQEANGSVSWLCMERTRDTDLVFHPVQRWLKEIIDANAALMHENQNLKEQLTKKNKKQ